MASARGRPKFRIAVFDDRQWNAEGDEERKVLAFWPSDTPLREQIAAVGLVQAMSAFMGTFTGDSAGCSSMDGSLHTWVVERCEPHIWAVLVVEASWLGGGVREEALREQLRDMHALCVLQHGPITQLLKQDPGAAVARAVLQPAAEHLEQQLGGSRSALPGQLHSPLSQLSGVPYFPLSRRSFLGLQTVVSRLLIAAPGGGGAAVSAVLALHGRHCLWSSMQRGDTAVVYRFAASALLPHLKAAPSAWKLLTRAAQARVYPGGAAREEEPSSTPVASSSWEQLPDGFLALSVADDFKFETETSAEECAGGSPTAEGALAELPTLRLQEAEEACQLLPLRVGGMLLLMLLQPQLTVTAALRRELAAAVSPVLQPLSAAVAEEVAAAKGWHIKGFRYLYIDHLLVAVRGSPPGKVATLSRESLLLLHHVRCELDRRRAATGGSHESRDEEMLVKGGHDCWVAAQQQGERELYLVLEGRGNGEGGLVEATETARQFMDTHMEGLFL